MLLGLNSLIYAQDTLKFTDLYGDYLGQSPPGDTPVVFARGFISTDLLEHSYPSFTPDGDEVFWFVNQPPGQNNKDWLSFHDTLADTWTDPINMGEPVNSSAQERLPGVSPDGKYLFFTRWTPDHNQDIFWVSAKIIERLREQYEETK